MAVGDNLDRRWSLIVCMVVGYRLHGRWRSFVWLLEIVCMAVGDRLYGRTISNGHTNDLQRPCKRSNSNGHAHDLQRPYKRSDRLYGRWRSFEWPLEIVCMAVDDRLYGRWRLFVWSLEIVCMAVGNSLYGCWRSFVWPLKIVWMAVGNSLTAIQTIFNGHTNDLQRP
jgi:hypothetical protein